MVEKGKAPVCNKYNKCNNAEGCFDCKEFEEWLAAEERKRIVGYNPVKESIDDIERVIQEEERHRYDPIAGDD